MVVAKEASVSGDTAPIVITPLDTSNVEPVLAFARARTVLAQHFPTDAALRDRLLSGRPHRILWHGTEIAGIQFAAYRQAIDGTATLLFPHWSWAPGWTAAEMGAAANRRWREALLADLLRTCPRAQLPATVAIYLPEPLTDDGAAPAEAQAPAAGADDAAATAAGAEADDADMVAERAMLARLGFARRAVYYSYSRRLDTPLPAPDSNRLVRRALARGYGVRDFYPGQDDEHIAALMAMHDAVYRNRQTMFRAWREDFTFQDRRWHFALLALRAGEPVGYLDWCMSSETEAFVSSIFVDSRHWGTGAADLLAMTVLRRAQEFGLGRLTNYIEAANHPSRRMTERVGLARDGQQVTWTADIA